MWIARSGVDDYNVLLNQLAGDPRFIDRRLPTGSDCLQQMKLPSVLGRSTSRQLSNLCCGQWVGGGRGRGTSLRKRGEAGEGLPAQPRFVFPGPSQPWPC